MQGRTQTALNALRKAVKIVSLLLLQTPQIFRQCYIRFIQFLLGGAVSVQRHLTSLLSFSTSSDHTLLCHVLVRKFLLDLSLYMFITVVQRCAEIFSFEGGGALTI